MNKPAKLFQLELNEINFDFVQRYGAIDELPNLNRLIKRHGLIETTSETRYEELEPWIQWVTAHTGLPFKQHGVFRLGDIVEHDLCQIWEWLEERGVVVAATSPMNASNQTRDAAFFLPDPWTDTRVTGSALLKRVMVAASQAVNENAGTRLSPQSAAALGLAVLRYCGIREYGQLAGYVMRAARGGRWALALILDELLTAITISETRARHPGYVTLFLNGGAHLQHHYMFNSAVYDGPHRNPEWLLPRRDDPILGVYRQYDRLVGRVEQALPDYRLMIATGLHQNPYSEECYYWRLANHDAFLREIGCSNFVVHPRMSRDFLIDGGTADNAQAIQRRLDAAIGDDGMKLFDVDNRGNSLFVMLTYPKDISIGFGFAVENEIFANLRRHVNFVAIKNGEHDGIGYLVDTAEHADRLSTSRIALADLPSRIATHFGLTWPERSVALNAVPDADYRAVGESSHA
jgi:hypothetical protein